MRKVISWTEDQAKKELRRRREAAEKKRKPFEEQAELNIRALQSADGSASSDNVGVALADLISIPLEDLDTETTAQIGVNYIFRYTRFRHSQLSANPPSVIVRPTSSDPRDKRKADAGDRVVRWIRDVKKMQEHVDLQTLSTVTCGTGYLRQGWDECAGGLVDFDEQTDEVKLKGDTYVYPQTFDRIWLDPHAKTKDGVRYFFEDVDMPLEEAIFRWPEKAEALKREAGEKKGRLAKWFSRDTEEINDEPRVTISFYWEKGLPQTGYGGRYAAYVGDFEFLDPITKNPNPSAQLGLTILTDIDVDGEVYGDSPIKYAIPMQEMLNKMDSSNLDNIQAHNVVRAAIMGEGDIDDEGLTNSAWDYIKLPAGTTVSFASPPSLMPDGWRFRDQYVMAIQDTFGINDSMMGIQRREQSAVSQQTSIEAGTMIHRRLFKKYEMAVREIFTFHLDLVRKHWDTPRTIMVLGKEKAFEAIDLKGSDIENGFDIVCEYGTSLPIDPNMRREAIMLMQPILEKAGVTPKQLLKYLKLNDLEGMYDRNEMAGDRQREIFEVMIAKYMEGLPEYIAPKEMRDQQGMLDWGYDYVNSSEFNNLPEPLQEILERHLREREEIVTRQAVGQPGGQPGAAPGPAGPQLPEMPALAPEAGLI